MGGVSRGALLNLILTLCPTQTLILTLTLTLTLILALALALTLAPALTLAQAALSSVVHVFGEISDPEMRAALQAKVAEVSRTA